MGPPHGLNLVTTFPLKLIPRALSPSPAQSPWAAAGFVSLTTALLPVSQLQTRLPTEGGIRETHAHSYAGSASTLCISTISGIYSLASTTSAEEMLPPPPPCLSPSPVRLRQKQGEETFIPGMHGSGGTVAMEGPHVQRTPSHLEA